MCDGLLLAVFSRGKDREGGLASDRQTEPLHLTIFSPPSRALAHTHASWHTHTHARTQGHRGLGPIPMAQLRGAGSVRFSRVQLVLPMLPLLPPFVLVPPRFGSLEVENRTDVFYSLFATSELFRERDRERERERESELSFG